jgi:hypothetical protein
VLAEVIQRNIYTSFEFDTIGTTVRKIAYSNIRGEARNAYANYRQIYYDGYFGVNMPIQFLWKDILDFKLIPAIGYGSKGYSTRSDKDNASPFFYLIQFDLLARLGGLKLNLGGEVRGYFPNQSPIFSAYLGTSFSIQKLADFIAK